MPIKSLTVIGYKGDPQQHSLRKSFHRNVPKYPYGDEFQHILAMARHQHTRQAN